MNLPTLSVVLPNYNHGHCLPVAVEAFLRQSVQPLEIIIVDDGSTDNSVEIIEALARKHSLIRFHKNEVNRKVSYTVNRGIDLARGKFVYSSSADDQILPGFFEKSLRLLARYPEAGLSCTIGDWRELDTGLRWFMGAGMVSEPAFLTPAQIVELDHRGKFFIPSHTAIMRREPLINAGKFIAELKYSSDWFADYVLALRHGVCVVPEPLAQFNIDPHSYYKRNRRDQAGYREVMENMVRLWNQPKYDDVAALIRASGSMFIFGAPMLRVMLSRPEYRHFITPAFLRKNLAHSAKLLLKNSSPAWLLKLYLKNSGYRPATRAS